VLREPFSGRMENWLQQVGFVKGNPFATSEAEQESQLLPEFFVDTGHYNLVWGNSNQPRTTLLFAPRGGGKTAYRLILQDQCRPADRCSDVLAVPYISFDTVLRAGLDRVDTAAHVHEILRNGLLSFLETLCDRARVVALPGPQRTRLVQFLRHLDVVDPVQIYTWLQATEPALDLRWEQFRQGVREAGLGRLLSELGVDHPLALLLAELVDSDAQPFSSHVSPSQLFAYFVEMVRSSGLKAVYVLVDRVDETPETADDAGAVVRLLKPLLGSLFLMETPGAAFKIFLPSSTFAPLRACGSVRFDRLEVYEIEWGENLLGEMLSRRLLTYSDGRVRALAQICGAPLSEAIDREVVRWADRSPRRLLRLGELLFRAHVEKEDNSLFLDERDWECARVALLREHRRLLRVDPSVAQVFVGQTRVALAPMEYRFLLALYEKKGWCEKEELIARVWEAEEGVTDQAVSRLVRRIREKIEPDPGNPIYLITEHSQGFRLVNVEWPQELGSQ